METCLRTLTLTVTSDQTLSVLSSEADTIRFESADQATSEIPWKIKKWNLDRI